MAVWPVIWQSGPMLLMVIGQPGTQAAGVP